MNTSPLALTLMALSFATALGFGWTGHAQTVPTQDLADITEVSAPDKVDEGSPVEFRIEGLLTTYCHTLDEPVVVKLDENRVEVYPIESILAGCETFASTASPRYGWFERELAVDSLAAGRYRLRVHSGEGEVIEKTFDVVSK
jgi:hypothetical protein